MTGPRSLYPRMIARDFARNRSVTVVLVVLMMLAVLLATASAGTMVRLAGASSNLMHQASAPDVAQLHAGPYDEDDVDGWVAGRPEVAHHQSMLMLGIDGANLLLDGTPQTGNIQQNSLVVPNPDRDLLLDLDNRPITEVAPGTVVLPVYYQLEADVEVGDPVRITGPDGYAVELLVAGFARDSIMNPAITSSKRFAVSPADLEAVRARTGEVEHLIAFWLHDPQTQMATFQRAYQDSTMPQAGQMVDAATFRMLTIIGDGLVAAVVVLVAALLVVVGLLCLRFSLLTAAEQDYREIGVLKAIGVPPSDLRNTYLAKYAVLAGAATVGGLLAGMAVTPLLTRNITGYMGSVPSSWNWIVPTVTAAVVFLLLMLFVLLLLRRVKKVSAVTALRSGPTAASSGASPLRLHRARTPVHVRLGAMDVIARWSTYLVLLLVFAVSTFIMIVPISSASTVSAPDFIRYMGTGDVDLRIDLRHADDASAEQFAAAVRHITADPEVADTAPMVTTRHATVDREGNAVSLYVENGDHGRLPVTYAEGRAPAHPSEIALSLLALHQSGREVGETVPVEVGRQVQDLLVVGSYQDITNGGRTAKASLPTDGDDVMWYTTGVRLLPGVDPTSKRQTYGELLAPAQVSDVGQWRDQTLGPVAQQIMVTAVVAAAVALALAMLMTALFTRMLIARDNAAIAIQRALGADDSGLRVQYLTRLLIVLLLGLLAGTVAANTLGEGLFNLMLEGLFGGLDALGQGTSRITFSVHPLLSYLALPAALLTAVTAATVASSRSMTDASVSTLTNE